MLEHIPTWGWAIGGFLSLALLVTVYKILVLTLKNRHPDRINGTLAITEAEWRGKVLQILEQQTVITQTGNSILNELKTNSQLSLTLLVGAEKRGAGAAEAIKQISEIYHEQRRKKKR